MGFPHFSGLFVDKNAFSLPMLAKSGIRGRRAGREAKMANLSLKLASGAAGPAKGQKGQVWLTSGLRGRRAGQEAPI